MVRWLRWHCPPEAEHATSRSRRLPTILTFTRGWGRNIFVFFKPPRPGTEPRTLAWKAAVLTTTPGPPPYTHKHSISFCLKCLRFICDIRDDAYWIHTVCCSIPQEFPAIFLRRIFLHLVSILVVWPNAALTLMTLTDHGHGSWLWSGFKRLWACHTGI